MTRDEARSMVETLINADDPYWNDKPKMVITSVEQARFGWLFFYTSSRYLRTKNISDAIAGNGPIYVVKATGVVKQFGSAFIQETIEAFEDDLKKGKQCGPDTSIPPLSPTDCQRGPPE